MAIANLHIVMSSKSANFRISPSGYMVRGVPKTVINDSVEFLGNVPEATFVEHIQRA